MDGVINVTGRFSTFKIVKDGRQRSEPNGWLVGSGPNWMRLEWEPRSTTHRYLAGPPCATLGGELQDGNELLQSDFEDLGDLRNRVAAGNGAGCPSHSRFLRMTRT